MTFSVHFITGNSHKFSELADILPDLVRVDIDLPEVQAVDSRDVIAAKLSAARGQMPGKAILVEDTALHLSCMNGFPGALIKWLLASLGCDGIHNLCLRSGDDGAHARTVLGYLGAESNQPVFCEGTLDGKICSPRGKNGFGWDPVFTPDGFSKSLAEMYESELRPIKMRRRAAKRLLDYLAGSRCDG